MARVLLYDGMAQKHPKTEMKRLSATMLAGLAAAACVGASAQGLHGRGHGGPTPPPMLSAPPVSSTSPTSPISPGYPSQGSAPCTSPGSGSPLPTPSSGGVWGSAPQVVTSYQPPASTITSYQPPASTTPGSGYYTPGAASSTTSRARSMLTPIIGVSRPAVGAGRPSPIQPGTYAGGTLGNPWTPGAPAPGVPSTPATPCTPPIIVAAGPPPVGIGQDPFAKHPPFIHQVPEPSTLVLLIPGLIGLVLARRRKQSTPV